MDEIKKKIKTEIDLLYKEGVKIFLREQENQKIISTGQPTKSKKVKGEPYSPIHSAYQSWYTKSLPIVKQLLPDRFQEFQEQYKLEKRDDKNIGFLTYTIYDYLIGLRIRLRGEDVINPYTSFVTRFQHQLTILWSANDRIDSILTDIEGVLQSELFTHELEAAEDLLKKGHLRAAGALTGVSLEIHLDRICVNHAMKISKKSPTISDYNEALKSAGIFDIPTWRHVLLLGDIRNLCVHSKEREPTTNEVTDLLNGTKKIIATTF